jgi:hypothetical protein
VTLGRPDVAPVPPGASPAATAAEAEANAPSEAGGAIAPAAANQPVPLPPPTAEEPRASWQERMNERLFVFEKGGWVVIEGWRRRMGPKEGEVWVTYEEMGEMKRTGRVPEGAHD